MKRNNGLKLLIFICFCTTILKVNSQSVNVSQVSTMYFMENVPQRNELNPAFQPYSDIFVGLPVIGYSRIGLGNSSPLLTNFVSSPAGGLNNFYNSLTDRTTFQTDLSVNLLSFGFRTKKSYWNFSLSEKIDGQIGIPKDVFKLLFYGTPDINSFKMNDLNMNMMAYTEAAFGYSKQVSDKWSYGAKLKFLYGNNDLLFIAGGTSLNALSNALNLSGSGILNYNSPFSIKPSGLGGAFDFGVTFKPVSTMTLSAALTDVGMIHWNKKYYNKVGFSYTGSSAGIDANFKSLSDSILNGFNHLTTDSIGGGYNSYITPKINVGAEFAFLDNKLSLGVLSRTLLVNSTVNEEVTASVNGRPADWINLSLSYSVFNGKMSNIGAGLGLRTGFLHWFLSADYIPLDRTSIPSFSIPIPYNTKGINLGIGLTIVLGNVKDADRDGVPDKLDLCPDTPKGVKVDKNGCPFDSDGDGVPDYLDKCPGTPKEAASFVDKDGCFVDSDGDGIPDYMDECPDTPAEAKGFVDKKGCVLDSDGDGVPDYLDKCPNTPADAKEFVDKNGCLVDTDGDGVPDYLDLCPNTPIQAKGFVDKNGCLLDKDNDGIPDYLDKCPDTPLEAHGMVDSSGCPRDTDGDGVPDYLDKCPTIPGSVKNNGCPEVKPIVREIIKEEPKTETKVVVPESKTEITSTLRTLFEKAIHGIQFEATRYTIKPASYEILDQIANTLNQYPLLNIEIQGHTDNNGKHEVNQMLSEKRAQEVFTYLVLKGVDARRMTYRGFGDNLPMASNKTAEGRALNRRVEFVITYAK